MDKLKMLKQLIVVLEDKNTPVRSIDMDTHKIVIDNKITLETVGSRIDGFILRYSRFIVRYNGKETILSSLTLALDHIIKILEDNRSFKEGDIVVALNINKREEFMLIPIQDSTKQFYMFSLNEYKLLDGVMSSEDLYNEGYTKLNN